MQRKNYPVKNPVPFPYITLASHQIPFFCVCVVAVAATTAVVTAFHFSYLCLSIFII